MIKKFVYWLADFLDNLWVTVFGEPHRTRDYIAFKNIRRERYQKDPKYPKIKGKWGKKTMFALTDKKGKKYDVDCLLVNNRFVVIDSKDKNRRKYVIW